MSEIIENHLDYLVGQVCFNLDWYVGEKDLLHYAREQFRMYAAKRNAIQSFIFRKKYHANLTMALEAYRLKKQGVYFAKTLMDKSIKRCTGVLVSQSHINKNAKYVGAI